MVRLLAEVVMVCLVAEELLVERLLAEELFLVCLVNEDLDMGFLG